MNKSYRSIWNESLQAWVAVSELQPARGKASRSGKKCAVAMLTLAAVVWVMTEMGVKPVWAACSDAAAGVQATAGDQCSANLLNYTGSLRVDGLGSSLDVTSVNPGVTVSGQATGLLAAGQGRMSVQQGITVTAQNASAIRADANSQVNVSGAAVVVVNGTTNTKAVSAFGSNSQITLNDSLSVTSGDGESSNAISAEGGGQVTVNGALDITTGVATGGTGRWISSIYSFQAGSVVSLNGPVNIQHTGVSERGSAALTAQDGGVIRAQGLVDIKTSGRAGEVGSSGVYATDAGSSIELQRVNVVVDGASVANPPSGTPYAVWAIGGGNISMSSTDIETTAQNSYALYAQNNSTISVNGSDGLQSTVKTSGDFAHAINAVGAGSKVDVSNAQINTSGKSAQAIRATAGSNVNGSSLSITTTSNPYTATNELADATSWSNGISAEDVGTRVTLSSSNIETQGYATLGVNASNGSNVVLNAVNVKTAGVGATGVWATGTSAGTPTSITVGQDSSITTTGTNAVGLGLNLGAQINADRLSVTTQGDLSNGIWVTDAGSQLALSNTDVQIHGNWASGMVSTNSAIATLSGNNTVHARGAESMAWRAENQGAIYGTGSAILQSNANNGTGIAAKDGGVVDFQGALQISQSQTGVLVEGNSSKVHLTTNDSSSLISAQNSALVMRNGQDMELALTGFSNITNVDAAQPVIDVTGAGGASTLTLAQTAISASENGSNRLLNVAASSGLSVNSIGSTLKGDIEVDASPVKIALDGGSTLTGAVNATGAAMELASNTDVWNLTRSSALHSLNNGGHTFFGPVSSEMLPADYRTISVDNYIGSGGHLHIRTYMDASGSASDKLVINAGGTATGTTTVHVLNSSSSLGAPTSTTGDGLGIQVVQAMEAATTGSASFVLPHGNAPIQAGAYEYSLVRNANESWYLTSSPEAVSAPEQGSDLGQEIKDNVRPAVSLYSAAPSLMALQNAAVIDTLHERMGSQPSHPTPNNAAKDERLWVRLIGNDGSHKPKGDGVRGAEGAKFDHHTYALQLGADLQRSDDGASKTTASGMYFTHAQSTDRVEHYDGRNAGKSTLDGTSLGAYWTRFYPKGSYVDLIGQVTSYRLRAQSPNNQALRSHGKGFTVSAEGGHAFDLSDEWVLQPQAQLRVQRGALGSTHDGVSRVRFDDLHSTVGRVGVRLAYSKDNTSLWARADFLREFEGRSKTTVANMAGMFGAPAYSSLHGNSVALSLGAEAKLSKTMSIYASGRTERRMGDRGHYNSLMLGGKWAF